MTALNRFQLPNVKQEVLEVYEYKALNNKNLLNGKINSNYNLLISEEICEVKGTYAWNKIHLNDEYKSNFSWCLDSVALCLFTKCEKEIKKNNSCKDSEKPLEFNYDLDVLFAEKRYEEIIRNYNKYDSLESLSYVYKSYILNNENEYAIPYLLRYIAKALDLLKYQSIDIYKMQLLQKSLLNAIESLLRVFIELECNVDRIYIDKIGELIKEHKIMHDILIINTQQLSKLIFLLFSSNRYHEILCFKDIKCITVVYYLGRLYKNLEQNDNAIEFLSKYIHYVETEKCNSELFICSVGFLTSAYFHLGEILYYESQESEALRCFKKCIQLSDDNHKKAKEYLNIINSNTDKRRE